MLYVIQYGYSQERESVAIFSEDFFKVKRFAEQNAIECYQKYLGNRERNKAPKHSYDWWDKIYSEIYYTVEIYDETNPFHQKILLKQQMGFFMI